MDREEKLKAAKDKLKKFQKKKRENTPSESSDQSKDQDQNVASSDQSLPLFTMPSANCLDDDFVVSHEPAENFNGHRRTDSSSSNDPQTAQKHASLSEQIAGVLSSSSAVGCPDGLTGPDFAREKEELQMKIQHQGSSILQFQAHCKSLAEKLDAAEEKLIEERKDFERKVEEEKSSLSEQLKSHTESIHILVTEKTDLEGLLEKTEGALAVKDNEIERLKTDKKSLEEERTSQRETVATASRDSVDRTVADRLEGEAASLKQEMSELSSKYAFKGREVADLASELAGVRSKLEMAELNLSQLRSATSGDDDEAELEATKKEGVDKDEEIRKLERENDEHEERVKELTSYIQKASQDREEIIRQYTSYSQQLTAQIETLTKELDSKKMENHALACREADLVAHVQRLEEQLQQLMRQSKERSRSPADGDRAAKLEEKLDGYSERAGQLESSLKEAAATNEALGRGKKEEERKVAELTTKLREAKEKASDLETKLEMERMDGGKDMMRQEDLVAACQSDKVAASRATTQNVSLKKQLVELELAVIQTTNSKAAIASELESLSRKEQTWTGEKNNLAMELSGLKAAVNERDRSIDQLKEQLRHYGDFVARGKPGTSDAQHEKLVKDLQDATETIRRLQSDSEQHLDATALAKQLDESRDVVRSLNSYNSELKSQLEVLSMRTNESSGTPTTNGTARDDAADRSSPVESTGSSSANSSSFCVVDKLRDVVPPLSPEVALLKLEEKFKQAMMKNVELASEKERLEHIVVQLQEETDTVGEYVTIYQYQRTQQKLRLQEKERQLQTLSREREDLKSKLEQLHRLIETFIQEKSQHTSLAQYWVDAEMGSNASTPKANVVANNSPSRCQSEHYEVGEEATESAFRSPDCRPEPIHRVVLPASEKQGPQEVRIGEEAKPEPTADKILALITEIGSNQILGDKNFHPWFWEPFQGELMTV